MRIGMLAPPWVPVPPPRYGGTEGVIDGLSRGLTAAGHEVLLWTTGDSTCPVERGHVLERAHDDIGRAGVELSHSIRGHQALRRWGADVIHDHTLTGPVFAMSMGGPPVVTTVHGSFDAAALDLYRAVGERVPVIAISHDQARRAGGVPVAAVIHHGIDIDDFEAGSGDGDDEGPYLAFLGRMAPDKGVHLAARAARAAGHRLLIAAKMREPAEQRYFAAEVEPLLGDGVTYVGEVDPAERRHLLRGATALVNPIQWPEPFGLVMVEALACGTPVVAFRHGSAPEIVCQGVTGYVCADLDELTACLAVVDRLDRAACRAAAEVRFSLERMVADHECLYRRVTGEASEQGARRAGARAPEPVA